MSSPNIHRILAQAPADAKDWFIRRVLSAAFDTESGEFDRDKSIDGSTFIYEVCVAFDQLEADTPDPKCAGSVSTATLRPEDLIPRFLLVLEDLAIDQMRKPVQDSLASVFRCAEILKGVGRIEERFRDSEDNDNYSDEAQQGDLEWLENRLNDLAPVGYYFGAHPDDGADFGFWREWV